MEGGAGGPAHRPDHGRDQLRIIRRNLRNASMTGPKVVMAGMPGTRPGMTENQVALWRRLGTAKMALKASRKPIKLRLLARAPIQVGDCRFGRRYLIRICH